MRSTIAFGVLLGLSSCATTSVQSRDWGVQQEVGRTGEVVNVREVIRRVQGNPAAGAVAGGLIGGILFGGRGGRTLFGAAVGAATGAALSSGGSEMRGYEVTVRFDDGTSGVFTYRDYSPFRPGDRVQLTPGGPVVVASRTDVY